MSTITDATRSGGAERSHGHRLRRDHGHHTRHLRATTTALAAALLVALAGCGDSADDTPPVAGASGAPAVTVPADPPTTTEPEASPAAPDVDPCALVTKGEAEKLAGTRLDDAIAIQQTCTYTGPVTGPTAQVEVFVGDGAAKFLGVERDLGHELRPLSGIGDEAYATDEAVFINKSGLWVAVRLVRLNDPAENRKPLEQVARTVAGRM